APRRAAGRCRGRLRGADRRRSGPAARRGRRDAGAPRGGRRDLPGDPRGGPRMTRTLLVIGAGPKALAVAAKARVLSDLGLPAPRIVVIDQHAVAANWLPLGGWTDGRHRLGTSPEKDIGFPYRSG